MARENHRPDHRRARPRRRGAAGVAMVIVLILLDLIVIRIVLSGSRDLDLTARRAETLRAYYAAESGINMAVRELMLAADLDGDTGVGTISDDSDDNTDPALVASRFVVVSSVSGDQTLLTSRGRSGNAMREMSATTE
jgi:Tfp pilus assembly protein PilX